MDTTLKKVAVIPGDDAAPEAIHPTLGLLRSLELPIEWRVLPDGNEMARTMSRAEAEDLVREAADSSEAVFFGATSGKTAGIGYLRWGKQTFANVRPIRWRPGYCSPLKHPEGIDYVIVRENIEDLYYGIDGDIQDLLAAGINVNSRIRPGETLEGKHGAYAVKVITEENTRRVAEFSCQLALNRKAAGHQGKVTCSAKYNMLRRTDELFRRLVAEVVAGYPDLVYEEYIVDDFARRLVANPHDLDVVVMPNLFGDILSDEGAGTIGGLGLAPSGCYGAEWAYFEPVHGTAPDIAGRGIINPTASILSAAMMLDYLGFTEAAGRIEAAIESVYAEGRILPVDQGGSASTEAFVARVRDVM